MSNTNSHLRSSSRQQQQQQQNQNQNQNQTQTQTQHQSPPLTRSRRLSTIPSQSSEKQQQKQQQPSQRTPKIGDHVDIWWSVDQSYYRGKLTQSYKSNNSNSNDMFRVNYDDGDQEDVSLSKEVWKFSLPLPLPSPSSQLQDTKMKHSNINDTKNKNKRESENEIVPVSKSPPLPPPKKASKQFMAHLQSQQRQNNDTSVISRKRNLFDSNSSSSHQNQQSPQQKQQQQQQHQTNLQISPSRLRKIRKHNIIPNNNISSESDSLPNDNRQQQAVSTPSPSKLLSSGRRPPTRASIRQKIEQNEQVQIDNDTTPTTSQQEQEKEKEQYRSQNRETIEVQGKKLGIVTRNLSLTDEEYVLHIPKASDRTTNNQGEGDKTQKKDVSSNKQTDQNKQNQTQVVRMTLGDENENENENNSSSLRGMRNPLSKTIVTLATAAAAAVALDEAVAAESLDIPIISSDDNTSNNKNKTLKTTRTKNSASKVNGHHQSLESSSSQTLIPSPKNSDGIQIHPTPGNSKTLSQVKISSPSPSASVQQQEQQEQQPTLHSNHKGHDNVANSSTPIRKSSDIRRKRNPSLPVASLLSSSSNSIHSKLSTQQQQVYDISPARKNGSNTGVAANGHVDQSIAPTTSSSEYTTKTIQSGRCDGENVGANGDVIMTETMRDAGASRVEKGKRTFIMRTGPDGEKIPKRVRIVKKLVKKRILKKKVKPNESLNNSSVSGQGEKAPSGETGKQIEDVTDFEKNDEKLTGSTSFGIDSKTTKDSKKADQESGNVEMVVSSPNQIETSKDKRVKTGGKMVQTDKKTAEEDEVRQYEKKKEILKDNEQQKVPEKGASIKAPEQTNIPHLNANASNDTSVKNGSVINHSEPEPIVMDARAEVGKNPNTNSEKNAEDKMMEIAAANGDAFNPALAEQNSKAKQSDITTKPASDNNKSKNDDTNMELKHKRLARSPSSYSSRSRQGTASGDETGPRRSSRATNSLFRNITPQRQTQRKRPKEETPRRKKKETDEKHGSDKEVDEKSKKRVRLMVRSESASNEAEVKSSKKSLIQDEEKEIERNQQIKRVQKDVMSGNRVNSRGRTRRRKARLRYTNRKRSRIVRANESRVAEEGDGGEEEEEEEAEAEEEEEEEEVNMEKEKQQEETEKSAQTAEGNSAEENSRATNKKSERKDKETVQNEEKQDDDGTEITGDGKNNEKGEKDESEQRLDESQENHDMITHVPQSTANSLTIGAMQKLLNRRIRPMQRMLTSLQESLGIVRADIDNITDDLAKQKFRSTVEVKDITKMKESVERNGGTILDEVVKMRDQIQIIHDECDNSNRKVVDMVTTLHESIEPLVQTWIQKAVDKALAAQVELNQKAVAAEHGQNNTFGNNDGRANAHDNNQRSHMEIDLENVQTGRNRKSIQTVGAEGPTNSNGNELGPSDNPIQPSIVRQRLNDSYEMNKPKGGVFDTGIRFELYRPNSGFTARVQNLISRQVTLCLLETPHEKNNGYELKSWTKNTSACIYIMVCDRLSRFTSYSQAYYSLTKQLGVGSDDLQWFIKPWANSCLMRARKMYRVWDPPPTDDEWKNEMILLRELTEGYHRAADRFYVDNTMTELQVAVDLTLLITDLYKYEGFSGAIAEARAKQAQAAEAAAVRTSNSTPNPDSPPTRTQSS